LAAGRDAAALLPVVWRIEEAAAAYFALEAVMTIQIKEMLMKRRVLIMIIMLLSAAFMHSRAQGAANFDIEKLLIHVFDPQPRDKVLIIVDLPHGGVAGNPTWANRRDMASEWQAAFQELAAERGFKVLPMLSYPATGAHNKLLPELGEMDGKQVSLDQVFAEANIAVVMTKYSATAPLTKFIERYPNLCAASMPMVSRNMQETALNVDYSELARKCRILWEKLDWAEGAQLEFSTGHQLNIDLRERGSELDDGQLHVDKRGARVINLLSGEAYIAPYEGKKPRQASRTQGEIPVLMNDTMLTLQIQGNHVMSVQGEGGAADELSGWFDEDPARTNIAELGLGCNDKAVITGKCPGG
jgi:hypothetical protein